MGVLLEAFYRIGGRSLPSPADGDQTVPWWWDHLAAQANDLRRSGFTAVWLPPVLKNDVGTLGEGYSPFDDYDIGSRNQKKTLPTRYGTRQQLQRCVAMMRSNGLDVYLDMVEHHRKGDLVPFVFQYPDAFGVPGRGRFPKSPSNFLPQVARDPHLGGPAADDAPFGRELAPINALPKNYVFNNLIDAADWLTRALDVQGYRLDDVKGLSTDFLRPFLNAKAMAGKFAVGEFFDGSRVLLNNWIFNPQGMQGRSSAFDFPMKFVINAMCNNAGRFDMANLDHVGLAGVSPLSAVTFVENADTDIHGDQAAIFNKILGYAYILTSEGYPSVYYRDYSTDKNCLGLKPAIDNLIWIHENLAFGETLQRWRDFDVFAFERLGGPRLLVGLNNNPGIARTITVATGFGGGIQLHDYMGHAGDVTTDGNGNATITIPRNDNGNSYVCYSRGGFGGDFQINSRPVTQDFEAAHDLDIPPAINGQFGAVGSVWCDAGSQIAARLTPATKGWTAASSVEVQVIDAQKNVLVGKTFDAGMPAGTQVQTVAPSVGFYTFQVRGTSLPANSGSFVLSVSYHAPQQFAAAHGVPAQDPAKMGQWSKVINLPNVPIHTHVLPNGKLLFWGRRDQPGSMVYNTLNQHFCDTYLWDPVNAPTKAPVKVPNQPALKNGTGVNLFCSSHTFLPDGRLLVAGGHLFDSQGSNQACLYDPQANHWTATGEMSNGRWYPTTVTLSDGRVFVMSGSMPTAAPAAPPQNANRVNTDLQVWEADAWKLCGSYNAAPLYPRLHLAPDGRVFMSGPIDLCQSLDVNSGTWTPIATRHVGNREYAASVMYDVGKIIFIGGGDAPTGIVEEIDLNLNAPAWAEIEPMQFARRQHNATILADGTVLVTGGSRGGGFNNLVAAQVVLVPELWDPVTKRWTVMSQEQKPRCYHSTAVLLPDATVMSGGGGEYDPTNTGQTPNDPADTHADCQIFSPPYLFRGNRPAITKAPAEVGYAQKFIVETQQAPDIGKITFIRLSSVTHSFNTDQRINVLPFTHKSATQLEVTTPANGTVCPPGFYMLFVLNKAGVPSVAKIVRIAAPVAVIHAAALTRSVQLAVAAPKPVVLPNRPPVVVGVTATCPYGISACWAGAYHALSGLRGVQVVKDTPNAVDSTADVYLQHDGLPDLDNWPGQFTRVANRTHLLRGVEVTVNGTLRFEDGQLVMAALGVRPSIYLMPIREQDKVQLNQPLTAAEIGAYDQLVEMTLASTVPPQVQVTGPLLKGSDGYVLEVRKF